MKNYFNEKFLFDFLSVIIKNVKFFHFNNNENLNETESELSDIRHGLEEYGFIWVMDNINVI
jgi:hypothetical protein